MDDKGHSQSILILSVVFLAISLISVGLRCFVRTQVLYTFGWDDIFMVIAMILYIGFSICAILGARFGFGKTLAYFEFDPNKLHQALLCWWISEICYAITCIMVKISIIITLLRLAIQRILVWILYTAILLASAVGLIFLFFTIFQCRPVDYFWNQGPTTETGTCIDTDLLINIMYFYSASAAVTDLTIALVPVALVWNLRIDCRNKTAVISILSIGCIASVAVIIRIPFIHHYKDREFLYNTYQVGIWSYIEAGLGITAASLATLRPLGRVLRDRSCISRNKYHPAGSSPLSRDRLHECRTFKFKNNFHEDKSLLWGRGGLGSHQDITTVALGSMATSSEDIPCPENTLDRSKIGLSDLQFSPVHPLGPSGVAADFRS